MKSARGRPPKSSVVQEAEANAGFAPNQDILSELCGIDRRTLTNARQRFAADEPKKRADGRYPIVEYKAWLDRHNVRGRGENNPDNNCETARDLQLREWRLKLERAEFELAKAKEAMLPCAQFELALSRTMAAFLAALNAFGPRVNELLEGLDFNERAAIIEDEVEQIRKSLASCDYLQVEEDDAANG